MTDEELIAAFGWEPCRNGFTGGCSTHRDGEYTDPSHVRCHVAEELLDAARAGRELGHAEACEGIAERLESARDRQVTHSSDWRAALSAAAVEARQWRP